MKKLTTQLSIGCLVLSIGGISYASDEGIYDEVVNRHIVSEKGRHFFAIRLQAQRDERMRASQDAFKDSVVDILDSEEYRKQYRKLVEQYLSAEDINILQRIGYWSDQSDPRYDQISVRHYDRVYEEVVSDGIKRHLKYE